MNLLCIVWRNTRVLLRMRRKPISKEFHAFRFTVLARAKEFIDSNFSSCSAALLSQLYFSSICLKFSCVYLLFTPLPCLLFQRGDPSAHFLSSLALPVFFHSPLLFALILPLFFPSFTFVNNLFSFSSSVPFAPLSFSLLLPSPSRAA